MSANYIELVKRAVTLFPKNRHAQREWMRKVEILRSAPGGSKWKHDQMRASK